MSELNNGFIEELTDADMMRRAMSNDKPPFFRLWFRKEKRYIPASMFAVTGEGVIEIQNENRPAHYCREQVRPAQYILERCIGPWTDSQGDYIFDGDIMNPLDMSICPDKMLVENRDGVWGLSYGVHFLKIMDWTQFTITGTIHDKEA